MAVEGKCSALFFVSYFLLRKKFPWIIACVNGQSLLRRGFCCESQVGFCLWCRIVTNSCTCVSLIHFTKLLNKKIEGSLKGLFVVFLARFPYNPILYYAYSSLLKQNNSANN